MTGLPDSMFRSPARLTQPVWSPLFTQCWAGSHRSPSWIWETSKATKADSDGRPSRSVIRSRRQFHPASLWWEDPGSTASQCLPGPRDLNAINHAVVNRVAEIEVTGLSLEVQQGSVIRLGIERVGSWPGSRLHREGPAPGPSRLTRRMFRGLAVLRGGWRMSGLLLPLIIIMEDLGLPTYPDVDVQMSPVVPQAPEKRTFTVIPSPPRPAGMEDSADEESAGVHDSAAGDEPEVVDDSAGVADPAQEEDSAGVADSADRQDLAVDDSARGVGSVVQVTPAGTTLAAAFTPDRQGQDNTMVSDASSLISSSLPRQINHTVLLDCLSMMTLMQRRMDMAMPVPDTQSRPIAQTPTSRDDQTSPRKSGTPVRRSRTPVRRSRGMNNRVQRLHSFPISH